MLKQISDNVLSSFLPKLSLKKKNLIADCILAECEKLGMLPPVVTGVVSVETDGEHLVVRPWRWEQEND